MKFRIAIVIVCSAAFVGASTAAATTWYWSEARAESFLTNVKLSNGDLILNTTCHGYGSSTYSVANADLKIYNRFRCTLYGQNHNKQAAYDKAVTDARAALAAAKATGDPDAYTTARGALLDAEAVRAQYEAHGTAVTLHASIRATGRKTFVFTR
jgi:hypothetical protein